MHIQIDIIKGDVIDNRIEEIISFLEENQFDFEILEQTKKQITFSVHDAGKYSKQRFPSILASGIENIFSEESIKVSNPNDDYIGKKLTCHTSSLQKNTGNFSFTRAKSYPIIDEDLLELYIRDDYGNIAHVAKTDFAQHYFGRWFLIS